MSRNSQVGADNSLLLDGAGAVTGLRRYSRRRLSHLLEGYLKMIALSTVWNDSLVVLICVGLDTD